MRRWLAGRSTGDLLVLLIAGTICCVVLGTTATLGYLAIIRPDQDTARAAQVIVDIINTLLGLMAGFLAGRTDYLKAREERKMLEGGEGAEHSERTEPRSS